MDGNEGKKICIIGNPDPGNWMQMLMREHPDVEIIQPKKENMGLGRRIIGMAPLLAAAAAMGEDATSYRSKIPSGGGIKGRSKYSDQEYKRRKKAKRSRNQARNKNRR
jgi:hypothetical protein